MNDVLIYNELGTAPIATGRTADPINSHDLKIGRAHV